MLPCPKCGHDNELGRIFCHQCGTKLDLSQIKAPGHGGKRLGRRRGGVGDSLRWIVRLVIIGVLVWGVYLMAQVPEVRTIEHGSADLKTFYQRLDLLKQGLAQKQPVSVNFTEPQIAAHMTSFKTEEAEGRGVKVVPSKLQIELGDGVVTSIIVGRITLGSSVEKELYIRYTGVPQAGNGSFSVSPVSASIGNLPIHPLILKHTSLVQSYFKQIYGGLEEKQLLDSLTAVTVSQGVASLAYQPGPGGR